MKTLRFATSVVLALAVASSAFAAGNLTDGDDADLIYTPETGNVTLDPTDTGSMKIISFVLGNGANTFRTDNFTESDAGNPGPYLNVGTNTDNTPFQIGQTDPLNGATLTAGAMVDLGDIFPTGMANAQALADYLTLAEYASDLGQGGMLDLIVAGPVVPEPSTLGLGLIGLIGLVRVSRKRR